MNIQKKLQIFGTPLLVLILLLVYVYTDNYFVALIAVVVGSLALIIETVKSILEKVFALDYIALLAISTAVYTQEFLVALVIVLMLSGGNALEAYATARAKKSLNSLINRIPAKALLQQTDGTLRLVDIETIEVGQTISVRRGEVVPLDGSVISSQAIIDESTLSGEAYTIEKSAGDVVRSGTVNMGEVLLLEVTKKSSESTYTKIVELVARANAEKAPIVRLANRYSGIFTLITLALCALAYAISQDIYRVLAVLVVATPCPLILATPIALFGGMNRSAAKNILIKNPASLEKLNAVTDVVFDKTGTITVGKPSIKNLEIVDSTYDEATVYSIAEALERNSLHPFAKTIVTKAHAIKTPHKNAVDVREQIGLGIFGTIDGQEYSLSRSQQDQHSISLLNGSRIVAHFMFEDKVKENFGSTLSTLRHLGISLHIFTGDKQHNTQTIAQLTREAGSTVSITADMLPEEKEEGVKKLKNSGKTVAMIGDGINDAPALASADVGMVFSNEEQTASSEAADIVLLQGNLDTVISSVSIARRTIKIALQSIFFGIGLSVLAMFLAAFGIIPPITGALIQEGIDIIVIFNALRASV